MNVGVILYHEYLCTHTVMRWLFGMTFLPPANEVCEGYVFTGVCLSTGGGRVWQGGMHATHAPPAETTATAYGQ